MPANMSFDFNDVTATAVRDETGSEIVDVAIIRARFSTSGRLPKS